MRGRVLSHGIMARLETNYLQRELSYTMDRGDERVEGLKRAGEGGQGARGVTGNGKRGGGLFVVTGNGLFTRRPRKPQSSRPIQSVLQPACLSNVTSRKRCGY